MTDEPSTDEQEQDDNDSNEPVANEQYDEWRSALDDVRKNRSGCFGVLLIGVLGWTMVWYLVGVVV